MATAPASSAGSSTPEPAPPPYGQQAEHSAWQVISQRSFGLYLLGVLITNTGMFCRALVLSLLVYRLTGSTFMVGVINFAQFAGVLFLAPWTGAVADRYDHRRMMVLTQSTQAVLTGTLALLELTGHGGVGLVILLGLLLGVAYAVANPVQKALLPALVDRGDLHRAVSLESAGVNLSKALGPLVGTAFVVTVGFGWGLATTALLHLGFVVIVFGLRPRPQPGSEDRPGLRDGVRALRERPLLLALLMVVAAVGMASDPAPTLGPAFAEEVFGRSDTLAGFIFGTFGLGAVLAAFTIARPAPAPYRRMAVLLTVMTAGTVVFALAGVLWVSLGGIGIAGFAYLAAHTQATALLYAHTNEGQRGRVMALWALAFVGTRPLAALITGSLADTVGLQVAALVITAPAVAAAVLAWVLHRRDRAGRLPPEVDPIRPSGAGASPT